MIYLRNEVTPLSNKVYKLLFLLFLGIFCLSAGVLLHYIIESRETQQVYDQLSQMVEEAKPQPTASEPEATCETSGQDIQPPDTTHEAATTPTTPQEMPILPEYLELYQINPDLVGWIQIEGTAINYPVVQRKDHRDYYLRRDFYGTPRTCGCLYVREACDVEAPSDNITIYGHMMSDGTMFADLINYRSKAFWETHQYIRFDTLRLRGTYQIVCVLKTSGTAGKGFAYHLFVDAEKPEDYEAFWQGCREYALYDTGLTIQPGDKLISLSTCDYSITNGRMVVVAKRVLSN